MLHTNSFVLGLTFLKTQSNKNHVINCHFPLNMKEISHKSEFCPF